VPRRSAGGTLRYEPERTPSPGTLLGTHARDIDVSASSFRNLLVGGGITGLGTVLCAASIASDGGGLWVWFWQLVFAGGFLWFVSASRGILSGRGFVVDRRGLYVRTNGQVVGVSWEEISAAGIGSLPWIQHRRPVHPGRRQAFELYPADHGFAARHPEFQRWLVEDQPPKRGLPMTRYRFFLPPVSKLPRQIEKAVQEVAPRKWVGRYRRQPPKPQR
jgi:hypothetical protein